MSSATLVFKDAEGIAAGKITIVPENEGTLHILSVDEAREYGEEPTQLVEDQIYEYELTDLKTGWLLRKTNIVAVSHIQNQSARIGRIRPGAYTGLLPLVLENENSDSTAIAYVEVRSAKLTYREDYRQMLEDIADKSFDLLQNIYAPSQMRLSPCPNRTTEEVQQQFAFLNSLLNAREFHGAVQKILRMPHHLLEDLMEQSDIRGNTKLSARDVRQITTGGKQRVLLRETHPMFTRMKEFGIQQPSLPQRTQRSAKRETVDTPENRFVKYVLTSFVKFLSELESAISDKKSPSALRLQDDISLLNRRLTTYLSASLFQEVTHPNTLSLGSPVLQRRQGYREVLDAWLKFNIAANLTWDGGNDVYGAGKRDAATLYEYWVFFTLLDLLRSKFEIDIASLKSLFEVRDDGFGLKLKSGRNLVLQGQYSRGVRPLNLEFHFNRTFTYTERHSQAGTWTKSMRPDYTLSIWPRGFDYEQAERQELIVHIHFDAKYKLDKISTLFGNDEDLEIQESAEKQGVYKRTDLLKMHSYRDAIHRSYGAYVLYPGTEDQKWFQYHELLPGLGAFGLRPGPNGQARGRAALSEFIDEVIAHISNRANQAERVSYHNFRIRQQGPHIVSASLPELEQDNISRTTTPDERYVFVWWCSREELEEVIKSHSLTLPLRMQEQSYLKKELVSATHVVLGSKGENRQEISGFWRIVYGPEISYSEELGVVLRYFVEFDSKFEGINLQLTEDTHPSFQCYSLSELLAKTEI